VLRFVTDVCRPIRGLLLWTVLANLGLLTWIPTSAAQPLADAAPSGSHQTPSSEAPPPLDLDPGLIQSSPVLRRWLKAVPNVLTDIQQDPSFRSRVRLGYTHFTADDDGGLLLGVRDVRIGQSRLTLNGDLQTRGDRPTWGTDLHAHLRPLGHRLNLAPVVGFQYLETPDYTTAGLNLGLKLVLIPSRTSAADLSLSQTWVAPGRREEVGLTTLSLGYAVTPRLRLATDIQAQNARQRKEGRISLVLEWMF
jgi:hypothetical protein